MKTLATSIFVAGTLILAPAIGVQAAAGDITVGDRLGTTEEEVRAALVALGAKIDEIELEDGYLEAEFTHKGQALEVEIDPATGLVSSIELEDDDDDDQDDDDDDGSSDAKSE